MALEQTFTTELIEKELITVELVEKELITVELKVIDILDYYRSYTVSNLIKEEATPTAPLPSKEFRTSKNFATDTLTVYLNGLKEHYITIVNPNTFEFEIDIISTDLVDVEYVEASI